MPLYEYVCPQCQVKFERLRPMSSNGEPEACPHCGRQASRVLSLFASFSRDASGETTAIAGGGGGCAGCAGGACASCSVN